MPHDLQIEIAEGVDVAVDLDALREVVARLLEQERPGGGALAIQLAGDGLLQALNREHRDIDAPTDVLSFAAEEGDPFPAPGEGADDDDASYLGDIAVSVEFAGRQAEESGIALDEEVQHIVVHGVLHLLGYDHETAAEAAALESVEEALLGSHIHRGRAHEGG